MLGLHDSQGLRPAGLSGACCCLFCTWLSEILRQNQASESQYPRTKSGSSHWVLTSTPPPDPAISPCSSAAQPDEAAHLHAYRVSHSHSDNVLGLKDTMCVWILIIHSFQGLETTPLCAPGSPSKNGKGDCGRQRNGPQRGLHPDSRTVDLSHNKKGAVQV